MFQDCMVRKMFKKGINLLHEDNGTISEGLSQQGKRALPRHYPQPPQHAAPECPVGSAIGDRQVIGEPQEKLHPL